MTAAAYLLDTNVVSEPNQPRSNPKVMGFLERLDEEQMFVSALTVGELRKGAEKVRHSDRLKADRLILWIDQLERTFAGRILPVDSRIATLWGRLSADRPRSVVDTLIAATALVNDLILLTRNTRDVRDTGVVFVNPWE